jgi:hypothetical protein
MPPLRSVSWPIEGDRQQEPRLHGTMTTPSGFVLNNLLGPTKPRPDTSGEPLSELLGKALAHATGVEYQPPKVRALEQVLGPEKLPPANGKFKVGGRW